MESLYLLLPLSVLLVLVLIGLFAWALHAGQFDDLEREGQRLLEIDDGPSDAASTVDTQPHGSSPLDRAQETVKSHNHNVV